MGLTPEAENALVTLVRQVAKAEIRPRFRALPEDDIRAKADADDLVTEADIRSEAAITEAVRQILPDALVVGEEAVSADASILDGLATADQALIIDPVDGTWNFARGLATFGVILALVEKGETRFGLLYDVVMDDWVLARKGGGTWFCRPDAAPRQLQIGGDLPLDQAKGLIPLAQYAPEARARVAAATPGFGNVWTLRCSCHEYRLLSQGHVDFCLSSTLNPWDHAAGTLAVTEAGGAVGLIKGGAYKGGMSGAGCVATARSQAMLEKVQGVLGPLM